MENVDAINNEMNVNDGTQTQISNHYNRQIIRQVANGKVSIPLERTLEKNYGKKFVEKYKEVLKNSEGNKTNDRRSVINLSAYARAEEEKKEEVKETDKEYYLRILQRRLDLIEQKYGIKFDQELIDFFKSDEYFKNGNINLLEEYETLDTINKVWTTTDVLDTSTEEIDKVAEENKKAMDIIKNNALKYGDSSLYSSIVDDCNELDNFIDKSKKDAIEDERFFNEQLVKDRVERAILTMAIKNNDDEKIKVLAEVLIESINKRANYVKDEMDIKNYRRNAMIKEENAESIDKIKTVKDSDDKLVVLLNERRKNRPNSFGPKVVETKEEVEEIDKKVPQQEKFVSEEKKKEDYYDVYHQEEKRPPVVIHPTPIIEQSEPEMEKTKVKVLTFNKPNQSNMI